MKIDLGVTAKDKITGFQGVATGRAVYITGCNQILLSGKLKADGDLVDGRWFDEDRLDVVPDVAKIMIGVTANGPDTPAPIK